MLSLSTDCLSLDFRNIVAVDFGGECGMEADSEVHLGASHVATYAGPWGWSGTESVTLALAVRPAVPSLLWKVDASVAWMERGYAS